MFPGLLGTFIRLFRTDVSCADHLFVAANVGAQRNSVARQPGNETIVLRQQPCEPIQALFCLTEAGVRLGKIGLKLRLLRENKIHRLFDGHRRLASTAARHSYEWTQAITKLVTRMFSSPKGSRTFQPKAINWSYRKRGSVPRTQM